VLVPPIQLWLPILLVIKSVNVLMDILLIVFQDHVFVVVILSLTSVILLVLLMLSPQLMLMETQFVLVKLIIP